MAATKQSKPKAKRESALVALDATATIEEADLDADTARKTQWVGKLNELIALVDDVTTAFVAGKWYKVGSFTTASGARGVVRGFEDNPERKANRAVDIRSRIIDTPTGKASELYAKVVPVEAPGTSSKPTRLPQPSDD